MALRQTSNDAKNLKLYAWVRIPWSYLFKSQVQMINFILYDNIHFLLSYRHNYMQFKKKSSFAISSVQFSPLIVSDSLWPHELQHTRPPCPSPTPRVHPNPCPLSQWCHPTISFSVIPFSSCPQSFPASRSFQMSQLFTSGGQSIGVSASTSVLPMNT